MAILIRDRRWAREVRTARFGWFGAHTLFETIIEAQPELLP